jgi:hypothetical protein
MKTRLATAVLFGALCALPATGFAHGKGMMGKKHVKLLNDSAAALSTSNPDLSSRLKEMASKEGSAKEGKAKVSKAAQESAADEDRDVQTLKDAASALKTSRPDLAKGLEKFSKMEAREFEHKKGVMKGNHVKGAQNEGRMPDTKGETPPAPTPSGY